MTMRGSARYYENKATMEIARGNPRAAQAYATLALASATEEAAHPQRRQDHEFNE